MRTLTIALLTCAFVLAADSAHVGTWTMNKSKSKVATGGQPIESLTVQFVQDGSTLKAIATTNGTAAPAVIADGKEHAATASPNSAADRMGSTHYVSTVNGNTVQTVFKKDGKTVGTRKSTVSADGKTRTSVTEGTGSDGKKFKSTLVFDKQ